MHCNKPGCMYCESERICADVDRVRARAERYDPGALSTHLSLFSARKIVAEHPRLKEANEAMARQLQALASKPAPRWRQTLRVVLVSLAFGIAVLVVASGLVTLARALRASLLPLWILAGLGGCAGAKVIPPDVHEGYAIQECSKNSVGAVCCTYTKDREVVLLCSADEREWYVRAHIGYAETELVCVGQPFCGEMVAEMQSAAKPAPAPSEQKKPGVWRYELDRPLLDPEVTK